MLQLKLVCKSRGDNGKPTVNTSDLIKAGFLKKAPKAGEKVELKLVNSGGIVAVQDFYANRDGNTLYAREGFNDYLFDAPEVGYPTVVGCCGLASSASAATSSRPTGLSAIQRLISSFPTKVAAAASIGVSVDTLRRMLNKAQEEATLAARSTKRSSSSGRSSPTRGGSRLKASSAPAKSRSAAYGKTGITKTALKQALRFNTTLAAAGSELGVSSDTVRRAKQFFGL